MSSLPDPSMRPRRCCYVRASAGQAATGFLFLGIVGTCAADGRVGRDVARVRHLAKALFKKSITSRVATSFCRVLVQTDAPFRTHVFLRSARSDVSFGAYLFPL